MNAKFRVWMIAGQKPDWSGLPVIKAEPYAGDSWTVVVEGDGSAFERYVRTRRDLFTLYERVTTGTAAR